MLKTTGIALIGVLVLVGLGWVWGASGRSDAEEALRTAELRAEFAEARSLLLEARVNLFTVNFGNAARALDDARARVTALQTRLREAGAAERAGRLEIALAHIGDASRLTLALAPAAQNAAEGALVALAAATVP